MPSHFLVASHIIQHHTQTVESSTQVPESMISVWHGLVHCYLLAGSTDDSEYQCLVEFLNREVNQDVQFIVRIFASFETRKAAANNQVPREDSGESDERVAFDLLEFLELAKPSNMEAPRQKLLIKGTQEDTHFRASNPLSTRPYVQGP